MLDAKKGVCISGHAAFVFSSIISGLWSYHFSVVLILIILYMDCNSCTPVTAGYQSHVPLNNIFFFRISKVKLRWTLINCFHEEFNCRQGKRTIVMETFD